MFFTLLAAIVFAFADTELSWRPYIYEICFVILATFGFINGYVTSRNLKFFGTTDWNFSATIAALVLPLFIIGAIFLELLVAWVSGSALRYTFGETLLRSIGWYLFNGTMCYYGAFRGYVEKATVVPSPIGKIARPQPGMPWFMGAWLVAPVFGFI